jgi:hypothetical protein
MKTREFAYQCLENPIRFLGIHRSRERTLDPDFPAALSLDSLQVFATRSRAPLTAVLGADAESALLDLPHIFVESPPFAKSHAFLFTLRGVETFLLRLNPACPGCHTADLFRTIEFCMLPEGSFLVIGQNNLCQPLVAHIATDSTSRQEAILAIARAFSDQPFEGWVGVQKAVSELAAEPLEIDVLAEWDPHRWPYPLVDDTVGARMFSETAVLLDKFKLALHERHIEGAGWSTGIGSCKLELKQMYNSHTFQITLSNGFISAIEVKREWINYKGSSQQDLISFGGAQIPLDSQAADQIVAIMARHILEGARWTKAPWLSYEDHTVPIHPRPGILDLAAFFTPADPAR